MAALPFFGDYGIGFRDVFLLATSLANKLFFFVYILLFERASCAFQSDVGLCFACFYDHPVNEMIIW